MRFVAKLNASATALQYSTYFGGTGDECITSIAVDSTGAVYFTGWSSTLNLPTTSGAIQSAYGGYTALPPNVEYRFGDAVVGKLNPAGSQLSYLTYLGGNANDAGLALALDSAGDAFVAGFTDSTNFPVTGNAVQATFAGDGGPTPPYLTFGDAFLAMVNPSGTSLLYSTFFGGARDDEFFGLALDGASKVHAVGNSYSLNWNVTANAFQPKYAGQLNVTAWPYGDAVYSVFSFSSASPAVTRVLNAEGGAATIAPNTWTQINGSDLAPDTRTWQGSDFVNDQMPTQLDGASVTVNGEKAFVYYISPVQIDILTPPDRRPVPCRWWSPIKARKALLSPPPRNDTRRPFFVFNGGPYVVATHADGAIIGPTRLYPRIDHAGGPWRNDHSVRERLWAGYTAGSERVRSPVRHFAIAA